MYIDDMARIIIRGRALVKVLNNRISELTLEERRELEEYARDTWSFVEEHSEDQSEVEEARRNL